MIVFLYKVKSEMRYSSDPYDSPSRFAFIKSQVSLVVTCTPSFSTSFIDGNKGSFYASALSGVLAINKDLKCLLYFLLCLGTIE